MKEPTGDVEAELDSYKRRIQLHCQDINELKLDLEIANRTISHLEGLIEQYKYQAFVNANKDDWK